MTMISDRLTDEQLAEILSGVVEGVEPTTQELTMAAELQERRKADSVRPVGYVSESAIFCLDLGQHEVITAKPEKDADDARYWDVIPLYVAPPVQETGVYKDMLNIIGLLENNEWAEHCTSTVLGSLLESEITRLVGKEQPAPERNRIRREHAEWSDKTFGDVGPVGPLKHLSKETLEAAADPSDPLKWADMQFLLWDAQRRMGISDEFVTRAMTEKLAINKAHQWPEPKDGEPRLHIKEQPVPAASSESVSQSLTDVLRDVIAERQRQVSVKGWTPEHDDTYTCGELSGAAISYIEPMEAVFYWPAEWHDDSFKPSDERRNLVKATALLLAEIERLDRISAASALSEVSGGKARED